MPVPNRPVYVSEPVRVSVADRPVVTSVLARVEVLRVPDGVVVTRSDVSDPVAVQVAVARVAAAVGVPVEAVVVESRPDDVGVSVRVHVADEVKSAVVFERLVGMGPVPDGVANGFRPPEKG